ncbi:hypothetical protein B0T10DRAFT_484815 [Thelonectria olida]|uniref:Cytochrome b5 heme-binding domain-containing protein n=1 Tax=Thelonectria olida TaxID=1576542 RepID=A0A9P9ATM3_9HYPO|nr:hypothetical protein B0T10DRAFT_484815 [Thelonectria olida]
MADSELRQRKPVEAEEPEKEATPDSPVDTPKKKKTRRVRVQDEEDAYSPYLDVLRVLSFLFLASCGLSYVITGGDSWWWGRRHTPDVLTVQYWKDLIKGPDPPIYLTPDELQRYDGTDAELPLYLALNGTVYDVTNGRHIYGPGGSYSVFAGVDAARAFVTGCFKDDRTPDMRNVELMFLPLDDPETDAHWTEEELAALRVKELEVAKQKVHDALLHWVNFFGKSKKYHKVGYLVREDDWLEKEPLKELCAPAHRGRKKRVVPAPSEPTN